MSDLTPTNKQEMIDMIAQEAQINKTEAGKALSAVIDGIVRSLQAGKQVSLLGFGAFSVKPRAARDGRNPRTGETIAIPAAILPVFKAGKILKDAVNSGSVTAETE